MSCADKRAHGSVPSFVIYGPFRTEELVHALPPAERSGGAVALMTLGRLLKERGSEVAFVGYDDESLREKYRVSAEQGECVAIYPEGILGNPLNAKRVVRWILYYIDEETLAGWESKGDLAVFYWNAFHPQRQAPHLLTVMRLDLYASPDRVPLRSTKASRSRRMTVSR